MNKKRNYTLKKEPQNRLYFPNEKPLSQELSTTIFLFTLYFPMENEKG